jgi:hypothetical protein
MDRTERRCAGSTARCARGWRLKLLPCPTRVFSYTASRHNRRMRGLPASVEPGRRFRGWGVCGKLTESPVSR